MQPNELTQKSSLPPSLEKRLTKELKACEQVLWIGQPRPGALAARRLLVVGLGALIVAFAITFKTVAPGESEPMVDPLEAAGAKYIRGLMILMGVCAMLMPMFTAASALRTIYSLTDRRVVILRGRLWGGHSVWSYTSDRLLHMTREDGRGGRGDLTLMEDAGPEHPGMPRDRLDHPHCMQDVDNVVEVERLIRSTLRTR